jgi:hypothetical protein
MRIDWNKELTAAAPDSADGGGGSSLHGEAALNGEHPTGPGCGRWRRDLEIGGKSPTAATQELGRGRGMS